MMEESGAYDDLIQRAVAAFQSARYSEAADLFAQAIAANPDAPAAHNNRGVALMMLAQVTEARACFTRAIALKPDYAEAHYNLGNADRDLGNVTAAQASYDAALALNPHAAEALNARGDMSRARGEYDAALRDFDRAIALQPTNAVFHNNRGAVLLRTGKTAAARDSFSQALALEPALADAHYNLGNALADLKDHEGALASFNRALILRPDYVAALNNRGNVLRTLKRHAEAIESYTRAIAAAPAESDAYLNRGAAAADMGRAADALADYERALVHAPDNADAHNSRGIALRELGRHGESEAAHRRAIKLVPDHAEAHWALSICLLQQGDFARGWPLYEGRWKAPSLKLDPRGFTAPRWQGEEARGKTILLHGEQGLGDAIHFSRYAPLVAARGSRVVLEVARPLVSLLRGLPGVTQIIAKGDALPPFDLHCPLLSLPLAFSTTLESIPAPAPIALAADKLAAWTARLGPRTRPRVGICWSGNPAHRADLQRSIPLAAFAALLPPGADYVSLQKDERAEDAAVFASRPDIRRFASDLRDFSDTAALCAQMDLVISVDTSIAHVAGTLGKPVWILLGSNSDWRWLLGRADSPWYPTARLYRQEKIGDWSGVFARVKTDLGRLLGRS